MIKNNLLPLICLLLLASCNNNTATEKEVTLKQQETGSKNKELTKKEITDSIKNDPGKPLAQGGALESTNTEKLLGYWFTPHAATINIRFFRNNTFVLNDYNTTLDKEERLTGNYDLKGSTLTLLYDDRPKQRFKFYKGEGADDNYYIKNPGNYFVKGENGDGQ
jgi:hypothetical protein